MKDHIKFVYSFRFENGSTKVFDIFLDRLTLALISEKHPDPPVWTELSNNKCANCLLDEKSNRYCPVAMNLANIVEEFKDYFSYEGTHVTVTTEERIYSKDTSLHEGLSSLIGIIMVTSGCPVLEHLKPMVRFHLPFATLLETTFRMVSMYLMAQYFLNRRDKPTDWDLNGLKEIYEETLKEIEDYFSSYLKQK